MIDEKLTQLQKLKTRPTETVTEYSNKIQKSSKGLHPAGTSFSELEIKRALLYSLQSSFVVTADGIKTASPDYDTVLADFINRESLFKNSDYWEVIPFCQIKGKREVH